MDQHKLQPLTRVSDLRSIWASESGDFTPWLAEHLDELSAELGLDLELTATEGPVGPFRVDLVARDANRNRDVIIENQLEPTDHTHLGQLLTYASGLDAATIIWIAADVRAEHRQAVDWLNQHTDEHLHFFAVKLGLVRIGDSPLAAHFVVEAAPNDWQKSAARERNARTSASVSAKGEAYRAFWQPLIDELREEHRFTNAKAAQPQSWYAFATGSSGVKFGAVFRGHDIASAEVYIDTGDGDANTALFEAFREEQEAIEAEMGEPMDWQTLPERRACRIAINRPGSIEDPPDVLTELHAFFIDRLLKLNRVFRPRLQRLRTR